jgi:hypothetical protein
MVALIHVYALAIAGADVGQSVEAVNEPGELAVVDGDAGGGQCLGGAVALVAERVELDCFARTIRGGARREPCVGVGVSRADMQSNRTGR